MRGERDPARLIRRWEAGLVALALRLLPRGFRSRFSEAMADAVADGLSERRGARRGVFLARSVLGIAVAAFRERTAPTAFDSHSTSSPHEAGSMDAIAQELRFAFRALRRRPGFSVLAVLTLALGIGSTTAVFSVVHGVLLRPLPYPDPDGLFMVWAYDTQSEPGRGAMSLPDIEGVRGLTGVQAVEGLATGRFTLTGGQAPVPITAARVTGSLLAVIGGQPWLGRDLRHEENSPDAARVVVVSHDFWSGRLGGDPQVLGTTLELDEVAYEIVGVMPKHFDYPGDTELWVPHRTEPEGCGRGCHTFLAVLRMAPGVSVEGLRGEVGALAAALGDEYPATNRFMGLTLEPLADYLVGDVRSGIWLLLGAVGGVLLIACANVANLLLVRSASRKTEVAVRSALGAGPRRMFGGILAESVVLAAMGALLGLAIAVGAVRLFRLVPPDTVPRMDSVSLDGAVLLFALALTVLVTVAFGLAPALRLARSPAGRALGGAARAGDRTETRSRAFLLATEVGLSVVLLAGAGLFLRSLAELQGVDLGFDRSEVVRFTLDLPEARYAELSQIAGFYDELEGRLAALPGVEAVGSAWDPPLGSGRIHGTVRVEGRAEAEPGQETDAAIRPMTPGFFDVLGLRLLRGRSVEETDLESSEGVAVVNETFVRENFPGEDPMGRVFRVSANFGWRVPGFRVIGVVADVRRTPTAPPVAAIYVPHAQFGPETLAVHVRGSAGAEAIIAAARDIVRQMDPNVPLSRVETMGQAMARATGTTRFYLALVAGFAVLAVVMAGVGLFGVVSYLVSRRTREIGIRVALGAGARRVRGMVLAQGLVPALWGVLGGVVVTLAAGRLIESLLFQVRARDPLVLGGVVVLLVLLTGVATFVPARRATRVDPVEALRAE